MSPEFPLSEDGHPPSPRGETLRRISSAIVGLYREHFGKGPTAAKAYAHDDMVVCALRDGLTTIEKTFHAAGRGETVRVMRAAFQDSIAKQFVGTVEELTHRRVVAFMSQTHMDPDLTIEVFILDRPLARALDDEVLAEGEEARGA